jgi:hypothetical protein
LSRLLMVNRVSTPHGWPTSRGDGAVHGGGSRVGARAADEGDRGSCTPCPHRSERSRRPGTAGCACGRRGPLY